MERRIKILIILSDFFYSHKKFNVIIIILNSRKNYVMYR